MPARGWLSQSAPAWRNVWWGFFSFQVKVRAKRRSALLGPYRALQGHSRSLLVLYGAPPATAQQGGTVEGRQWRRGREMMPRQRGAICRIVFVRL